MALRLGGKGGVYKTTGLGGLLAQDVAAPHEHARQEIDMTDNLKTGAKAFTFDSEDG